MKSKMTYESVLSFVRDAIARKLLNGIFLIVSDDRIQFHLYAHLAIQQFVIISIFSKRNIKITLQLLNQAKGNWIVQFWKSLANQLGQLASKKVRNSNYFKALKRNIKTTIYIIEPIHQGNWMAQFRSLV